MTNALQELEGHKQKKNPYAGMTRAQLTDILMECGGKPEKVKNAKAFRETWKTSLAESPTPDAALTELTPVESHQINTPWSLVPLEDINRYSAMETYALLERLEKDLGIKPPKGYDLQPLSDIKTWLCEQVTSDQVREKQKVFEESAKEKLKEKIRHINISNKRLRDLNELALEALMSDNDPPRYFVRGGGLVRITQDEKGIPSIQNFTTPILKHVLERAADFYKLRGDESEKVISPPLELVEDCLASGIWPGIPTIEGIVESPLILPDGTITTSPGYYADLRMRYIPVPGFQLSDIPGHPGPDDIARAVTLLYEIFEDFPFSDEASRVNAIATLITAVLRPVIPGYVPLSLIDKPQPGIGASLMTDIIAMVATGRPAAKMTAPSNEEEWRKTITARLSQGQGLIIIDNVDRRLFSGSLSSVITSDTWNDRVLGQSATITLSNHATFIANGINVETGTDIARRVYWIRMDAHQANPEQRTGFHHPDILEWVKEERGRILAAVLMLTRAWIQAGRPVPNGIPQMGSFEKWRGFIGGILVNAGVVGFLGNLEQFRERSDVLTTQWNSFLETLQDHFPGPFTVKEVTARLEEEGYGRHSKEQQSSFGETKIPLSEVIPDDILLKDKDPGRVIGKAFSRRADHVFPSGFVLRRDLERKNNLIKWVVKKEGPTKK
jgi:hypothetical protein